MKKTKIIFFGTSEFAVPALEALVKEGYDVVAVITTPDKPVGRKQTLTPPPVKVTAEKLGLKILQFPSLKIAWPSQPKSLSPRSPRYRSGVAGRKLRRSAGRRSRQNLKLIIPESDIGVVAAYGKIIPKEILEIPKHGLINIHPSLLPKYRGPTPIQSALLNGDEETGVTILKVDKEMDHGPTIKNQKLKIKNQNYKELEEELAKLGTEFLIKILPEYLAGKIKPKEQDHSQATFTKKFTWQDGKIDWRQPAKKILDKIKALNPEPGAWTILKLTGSPFRSSEGAKEGKILKIISASFDFKKPEMPAGKALIRDGRLRINASDGQIMPEIVQLESRQKLKIGDFLRGLKLPTDQLDFE